MWNMSSVTSVPLGLSSAGLPIGGQLIGPPFREGPLLAAAAVLEERYPPRMPPWLCGTDER